MRSRWRHCLKRTREDALQDPAQRNMAECKVVRPILAAQSARGRAAAVIRDALRFVGKHQRRRVDSAGGRVGSSQAGDTGMHR